MIPSIVVVGNHEQHKLEEGKRRLSHHWRPQFTLPEHGPEGLEETCYSIEYQDTLIVVLDSNTKIDEQAKWLDERLAANRKRWIICSFHHPVFSTAKDRDNPVIRAKWKPILDKYRVDLVLQGHDHSYGRTGIETPTADLETVGNVATGVSKHDEFSGTVYVVSVSGPKMYNLTPKPFMVKVAEDTQLYQVVKINGDMLEFEARTATGSLYDSFVLEKRDGLPNQLTERAGDLPERRRSPIAPAVSVSNAGVVPAIK
jgi:hypothetical protein